LWRARSFTGAAVATLALGIGLTTAVYSVVDAVLVQPIPIPGSDRLVVVWETDRDSGTTREPGSFPDFLDFRDRARTLDQLAAFTAGEVNLTPEGGDPIRLPSLSVTGGFFRLIGLPPILGRGIADEDDQPGAPNTVVISERLWTDLYQRAPAIVGRTIRLNGVPATIAGVARGDSGFGVPQLLFAAAYSRGFVARDRGADVDIWRALRATPESLPRETHPLLMVGRLAPGTRPAAAQSELAAIAADLERTYPVNQARGVFVESFRDVVIGPVEPSLLVLLAAVVFLLLISCVNVANLLLARATSRVGELAVRSALGAGVRHLARQFVVEGAVLTAIAGAAGVWFAFAAVRALLALAPPGTPRLADVSIDVRVLLVILAVSIGIAMTFGLLPLLHARRADLQAALRTEGGRPTGSRAARLRRSMLVAAEVALAVALVTAAGLLLRTVGALHRVDPGFDPTGVVKAEFQLPPTRYPIDMRVFPNTPAIQRFNAALLERVAAAPRVESAALAGNHPLDVGFTNSFVIVGREAEAANWPEISIRRVSPEYFDALKVGMVRGRLFDRRDDSAASAVALLNEAAVERFFAGRDPIGQEIGFWGANRRIVGIVRNEKFQGIAAPAPIAVYAPLAQAPGAMEVLLVRASADVRPAIRAAVRELDPALAVFGIEAVTQTVTGSLREQEFLMELLAAFAAIALVLAAVGIHGVLSYTLAQRTREIGVRVALGATRGDVMRLVVGQSARVTTAGLAGGVVLGLVLARWLRSWLYEVTPADPLTIAGVIGVLGSVAVLSSYFPTRRATRIDPATALRTE
jgi:predicted permease